MQDSLTVPTDNGPDTAGEHEYDEVPKKRGKRKDYFTASLPWPQKGDAVTISSNVDVRTASAVSSVIGVYSTDTSAYQRLDSDLTNVDVGSSTTGAEAGKLYVTPIETVNDLRLAFQTQRLLERDARAGTRYNEMILAHLIVTGKQHQH